jgi:hypothetical protein
MNINFAGGATAAGCFAGRNFLDAPRPRILLGVWEGLRAGWLGVAAAVALLWPQRSRAVELAAVLVLPAHHVMNDRVSPVY